MMELPIDRYMGGIVERVASGSGVVLVAAPGVGKTMRVGPGILRGNVLGKEAPKVVMLEPRRVAARASAERIAFENNWRIGEEVGYQVRFEKKWGERTRLVIFTEAILTRMLLGDPYLDGVGCVILDEFHERNLHTDLALAFLREVQQTVRPELKIVVMSATLEAEPVAKFLGAEVLVAEGKAFPVEIAYRPGRDERQHVRRVVEEAVDARNDAGDVLVFLPGVGEIERVRRELADLERDGCVILPLHGSLSPEEQQRALRPDDQHRRKIILATNIAETSLTIDGVSVVVDSGLVRVASFDADRGMDRLDLERISQASATQRAGRAGRQGPGKAYRLWAETEHKHLAAFNVPEVHRVDLSWAVLAIHAWGAKDVRAFGWFDRPGEESLAAAEGLLNMLGALKDGAITGRGRVMLNLPVHPRIGRMLLAAAGTKLLGEAVNAAAMLSDDGRGGVRADLLSGRLPGHLERAREQIWQVAKGLRAENNAVPVEGIEDLLLLAYPDRVARRRGSDPLAAVMVGGVGLRLMTEALTPAIASSDLFLALETHHDPRNKRAETMVRTAVPIAAESLERLFPELLETATTLEFDQALGKVVAITRRRFFNDLILHEDRHGKVNDSEAAELLLAQELSSGARALFLNDEPAARLLARVALVRHHVPEGAGGINWPDLLGENLQDALRAACRGKRSVAEVLESHGLERALREMLVYPLDRELDRLAPETIEVPSGSRIKLDYVLPPTDSTPPPAPILAVRLQELFGWTETPRICGGRVPVLLHLLSPGFKPMQVTSDLASFWRSAYFEVRKDLRVRYPKHKWPEDPLTATPEAKGRRRT